MTHPQPHTVAWRGALAAIGLLASLGVARAQPAPVPPPPLAAELAERRIEVTTAFTGGEILVFGATERLIGERGDEIVVLATGPLTSMVVREKIQVLGFWINGPTARFNRIPAYWALAGTRAVEEMLAADERGEQRLGLDLIPLPQLGARGPQFRDALRELKQRDGLWVDQAAPVEVSGGRLFHARLPVPSTVTTGTYRVQVMLVRAGRVAARQELQLDVVRVGTAAQIADVARNQPMLYGLACVVLAALAGWLGSVLFRRS
ncbi:TIGR02186 family protein [Falsiroseomonas oryziterrae]|uniref:TIGR02186 family protein n=1 Tax=Falsiroseomonas oryziterrae TaxID=2911368 RepID=UPI001F281ED2|nr:TIGR02186 family protein [Roseomonas sp. NPKOSM-4]